MKKVALFHKRENGRLQDTVREGFYEGFHVLAKVDTESFDISVEQTKYISNLFKSADQSTGGLAPY